MRKLVLSLTCLLFLAGVVAAAEVTLVKYDDDKKELTVKDGGAEKTYKLTDKTKIVFIDTDGVAKEGTLKAATKVLTNPKAVEKKLKIDITTDKDAVTELKLKGKKGK